MKLLLTTPLGWFLLGVPLLLALAARRGGRRPLLVAAGLAWAALVLAAMPVVAVALAAPLARFGLRWPAPPAWTETAAPEAIVVFSAGLDGPAEPGAPLDPESTARLHTAVVAARRWPQALLVVSGGSPDGRPVSAGGRMAEEAERLGLPRERLAVEGRSRDTRENGSFSAALLRKRGIRRVLLVTSPEHMARARACLAAGGLASAPLPTSGPPRRDGTWRDLVPQAGALLRTTSVAHELIGLAVYRVRGWLAVPPNDDAAGRPAASTAADGLDASGAPSTAR